MKTCPTCQTHYPDEVEFCANDGMKLPRIAPAKADPMVGRTLDGRWIIEEKIGEGGMGAVYRGHQRSVNREVAIKTLRANLLGQEDFVNRFFREAQVATQINHPHCVTILDFGQEEDGTLYLAMEFLEGEPLADRLAREGRLPVEEALKVGEQMASALAAAHAQRIVHRDLKPDNVFLLSMTAGHTFIKVLDFGIAKVHGANTQYTRTGQVFGTPDYMSPEQCSGTEIDGRSDLYSIGCILYELLSGSPPFTHTNAMATMMAHVGEQARPIGQLVHVPQELEQTIATLMAKKPADRIQTAAELHTLLKALRASVEGSGSHPQMTPFSPAAASGPLAMAETAVQEPLRVETAPHGEPGMKMGRKPIAALVLVVALILLAAGGVAAIALTQTPEDEARDPQALGETTTPLAPGSEPGAVAPDTRKPAAAMPKAIEEVPAPKVVPARAEKKPAAKEEPAPGKPEKVAKPSRKKGSTTPPRSNELELDHPSLPKVKVDEGRVRVEGKHGSIEAKLPSLLPAIGGPKKDDQDKPKGNGLPVFRRP